MDDVKKVKARKKRLPALITSLVLGLICLSGCSTGADLENGQAALDARDYESAITHLEPVVKKGPKDVEPYLLLATAYTETGDLYSARETLMIGYEKTGDSSLENVSIGGPLSAAEISLLMAFNNCEVPYARVEYHFSGSTIESYPRMDNFTYEYTSGCIRYLFNDTGRQPYALSVGNSNTNMGLYDLTDGYAIRSDLMYGFYPFLCQYDENQKLVSLTEATGDLDSRGFLVLEPASSSPMVSLTYPEQNCIRVKVSQPGSQAILAGIDYANPSILFEYNEDNRLCRTTAGERVFEFTYGQDNSCTVTNSFHGMDSIWEYNPNGILLHGEGYDFWSDRYTTETTLTDDGKIKQVETICPDYGNRYMHQYAYKDDGSLEWFSENFTYSSDEEHFFSQEEVTNTYNDFGQLVRIDFYDNDSDQDTPATAIRTLEYDELGRLLSMEQTSSYEFWTWANWKSTYRYLENGTLDKVSVTGPEKNATYQYYYDPFGNLILIE